MQQLSMSATSCTEPLNTWSVSNQCTHIDTHTQPHINTHTITTAETHTHCSYLVRVLGKQAEEIGGAAEVRCCPWFPCEEAPVLHDAARHARVGEHVPREVVQHPSVLTESTARVETAAQILAARVQLGDVLLRRGATLEKTENHFVSVE